MKFERHFTSAKPVYDMFSWKKVDVDIREGQRMILQTTIEVPSAWSQSAADILAHKYLRKAGVPSSTTLATREPITGLSNNDFLPDWLLPSLPAAGATLGAETSARQVFHRLAGHWTYNGFVKGYFRDAGNGEYMDAVRFEQDNARIFYDEIYYMLANQMAAPNSPQWFNTGLWWAYGLSDDRASACGYRAPEIGLNAEEVHGYEHPQTSACFILGLRDSLLGARGILDTVSREARIFKYGSGSGVNYSSLRGKGAPLSNGGTSSGLMSFLKLFDTNAGTIKSGGTTRRAARMAIVDADHPEAEAFVEWKAREELKVAAMVAGSRLTKTTPEVAGLGLDTLKALETAAYEGEAYVTVSGQNANNSLRVTDDFMRLAQNVTSESVVTDTASTYRNAELWKKTCVATWACGDPGMQFHDTINKWHPIPKVGEIRASNPCGEYMFIDDSSCNLASLNLLKFLERDDFATDAFEHAVRLWTTVLDISVGMSSYPDSSVAENSADYRAVGLGYANLGGLLMCLGMPYDSDKGRTYAGLVTALMHGVAWRTSAEMADELGPFRDFDKHYQDIKRVHKQHTSAAHELLARVPVPNDELAAAVLRVWSLQESEFLPCRNAQLTLLAPTGTIGLVMDCATTGVEPDFSLVKHKKLAGGGSMTLVNPLVERALDAVGYSRLEVSAILSYVQETGRVDLACPHIQKKHIDVFACAGDISVTGHIGMMAAVQPFLSGAISKTVNMPSTATVDDVREAFLLAWRSELKAVAIYRDGCKLSQPLTAVRAGSATNQPEGAPEVSSSSALSLPQTTLVKGVKKHTPRYKLPSRRKGFTQKVHIGNNALYLRTGEYADGRLGEVFMTLGRDGSTMRHFVDSLAVCISLGLQHGVPLQEYVDAFTNSTSEPNGLVRGSESVRMCSSVMDYVVRELASAYLQNEGDIPAEVEGAVISAEALATGTVAIGTGVGTNVVQPPGTADNDGEGATWRDDTVLHMISPRSKPGIRVMARPIYSGNACPACAEFKLRRSGSCHVCDGCGETTGCS